MIKKGFNMKFNLIILVLSGLMLQKTYAQNEYTCYYDNPNSPTFLIGPKVSDCSKCPSTHRKLEFIECKVCCRTSANPEKFDLD
jgi:hypothetical protein